MKKRKKKSNIPFFIALTVLLCIFGFSAWQLILYFTESQQQESRYDDLSAIVESIQAAEESKAAGHTEVTWADQEPEASSPAEEIPTEPGILPEYEALYQMNAHLVGWIRIDGTDINYPVMQTPDARDYYLRRNFDGEYSSHGCIYVREECDVVTPSDNVTIYGHHMRDGSMFADLDGYLNEEFLDEHRYIRFDTLTEHRTYEVFAVFKTTATVGKGFKYHTLVNAQSPEEFDEFIAQCKELAFYDTGITPEYGDKVICLSTCEYTLENGRLVVAAVLTDD